MNKEAHRNAGMANGKSDGGKILGVGKLTKKLTVVASAFSASAKAAIEAAGGSCEVIGGTTTEAPAKEKPKSKAPKESKADLPAEAPSSEHKAPPSEQAEGDVPEE